jgi:uncharacterized protein YaaQ
MKLLIAFIQRGDASALLARLREEQVSVTALESRGGFLRKQNTTLLLALPDDRVTAVIASIREVCSARSERVDTTFATGDIESVGLPTPTEVLVGGATVLVVSLEDVVKV